MGMYVRMVCVCVGYVCAYDMYVCMAVDKTTTITSKERLGTVICMCICAYGMYVRMYVRMCICGYGCG